MQKITSSDKLMALNDSNILQNFGRVRVITVLIVTQWRNCRHFNHH
ncbi:protein of unknown function [Vibrio tapetis subsp. tapetis]|uniref:Uncharacterized protein n=1 Tax=Vibrio tapetis subsp. tapetis TaxID=1671868 RepID=A0A2N8ZBN5_9VIBR|nr:protein of unknown function [Vibrio tapetis subsp. tapetis]